ncbi:MAG TPA: YdcF family protein [Leptolyngbyaceae cyanobacterium M65_K2018_010]|nr:YdcF family protein [Leptolyngbyaceae cyanobacterium M65_K2018_010]
MVSTGYWTHLGWRWFQQLLQPTVMLPLLISLIGVPRLGMGGRWRRSVSRFGMLLLVIYGLMALPSAAQLGGRVLALITPSDPGQTADAIVVLGRGSAFRPGRVQVAAELWQQGRAPRIFTSGRGDAVELGQMLEAAGVPPAAIAGEPCSATTNENAEFTAALLQPQGMRRIVLVTDLPHLLRSTLTFRSFGFAVFPHASPLPSGFDRQQKRHLIWREWAGLVSYGLLGRYLSRDYGDPGFAVSIEEPYQGPQLAS